MWSLESVVVNKGFKGSEGEREGLCLEGIPYAYSPLKILQDLWGNETHRTVAETTIRKSGRCHTSGAGGLAGENGAWEKVAYQIGDFMNG
jgi:hypothetical protein